MHVSQFNKIKIKFTIEARQLFSTGCGRPMFVLTAHYDVGITLRPAKNVEPTARLCQKNLN